MHTLDPNGSVWRHERLRCAVVALNKAAEDDDLIDSGGADWSDQ